MPMPLEIAHASEVYETTLLALKDDLDLTTRNQTYTVLEAVLVVFRRRLSAAEILRFAGLLPPVARAIFVAGWDEHEGKEVFGCREDWTREVKGLRQHHNFAPDDAIRVVVATLRRHMDEAALDQLLGQLPDGAVDYWSATFVS
ncbi:DUF2267 domain-containing protein [Cohaesibacter sp. CAU 1516]|uniref:DUF2267 domain-containing protein n=1 Tax=Cohaesibacter sp. CAU 1516 TaxID=2576038 RepID=UPI0010FEDCDD|nr:DUF2267 domain-containing protein [Cohaesibacter sp. CAU 1516]TLP46839.1 DUF2267 domain-containing protein [Cohaesibacter sp. CAU 1516]